MDPKQTLIDVEQAISDGDFAHAAALLREYREWRSRGGFEPAIVMQQPFAGKGDAVADRLAVHLQEREALQVRQSGLLGHTEEMRFYVIIRGDGSKYWISQSDSEDAGLAYEQAREEADGDPMYEVRVRGTVISVECAK